MRRCTAAFDTVPSSATVTKVLKRLRSIFLSYAVAAWVTRAIINWTRVGTGGIVARRLEHCSHVLSPAFRRATSFARTCYDIDINEAPAGSRVGRGAAGYTRA